MVDVHTPETRSYNMSKIRGRDTKPEEILRKGLFAQGFRYRKNDNRLPGKPDLVLPKYRTVIFVNGCFWHKHDGCRYFKWPQNNAEFWKSKIEGNVARDKKTIAELEKMGWNVVVVWECQLKPKERNNTIEMIVDALKYQ